MTATAASSTRAVPTKVCKDCGERKPWTEFYPQAKWEDGSMRRPKSWCKECNVIRCRNWRNENRERYREVNNRAVRRWRSNPENRSAKRAHDRDRRRRARNVPPERWYAEHRTRGGKAQTLPAAPFVAWLQTLDVQTVAALPASAEVLRRLRNGRQDRVSIDTVDRCCLHLDVNLNDIYPLEEGTYA